MKNSSQQTANKSQHCHNLLQLSIIIERFKVDCSYLTQDKLCFKLRMVWYESCFGVCFIHFRFVQFFEQTKHFVRARRSIVDENYVESISFVNVCSDLRWHNYTIFLFVCTVCRVLNTPSETKADWKCADLVLTSLNQFYGMSVVLLIVYQNWSIMMKHAAFLHFLNCFGINTLVKKVRDLTKNAITKAYVSQNVLF